MKVKLENLDLHAFYLAMAAANEAADESQYEDACESMEAAAVDLAQKAFMAGVASATKRPN